MMEKPVNENIITAIERLGQKIRWVLRNEVEERRMMNFENTQICAVEETKRETAKELLENMGEILREMGNQVSMISDAVYRGGEKCVEKGPANEPCATPPIVVMMRAQRDAAEHLLKEIVKIREAMW